MQLLCNPVRVDAGLRFPGIMAAQQHGFDDTVCQLCAKSRGRVTLRSGDPQDATRIALNLFRHEDDRRARDPRAGWHHAPPGGYLRDGRRRRGGRLPGLACERIAGLSVADATIMPTIVGGNTKAATLMIGETSADLIATRA